VGRGISKALTIAGSDSGGGAGIQADLKAFAAFGVHGSCVIVALTAQNTKEVTAIHPVPADFITAQLDAVMSDIGCDAAKIGMLANSKVISTVAEGLRKWHISKIVLDPVMVAASGARLLEDSAIATLKKVLIPLATVMTPNVPEAEVMVGYPIRNEAEIKKAAMDILALGCKSVLMKGGHLAGEKITDYFFAKDAKEPMGIEHSRINKEGHGTGCTLSSAIAALLARGYSMEDAVKEAVSYVHHALERGYRVGERNWVLRIE